MSEQNERFPSGLEAFFLFVMLFAVQYLIYAAMYDARSYLGLSDEGAGTLAAVMGNGVVFTAVMHYKGLTYGDLFHTSSSSPASTLLVLTPLIALTIPAQVLADALLCGTLEYLFPLSRWEAVMFERMRSGSFGVIIGACILAPILEEMLFRGIILRSFLKQYSKWTAIVGSATLFGFAHLNIYQFVGALFMGIFAGWLYERSRSLLPCIVLHAAYNSTLVMMDVAQAGGSQINLGDVALSTWIAALLLCAAGAYLLRRVLIPAQGR